MVKQPRGSHSRQYRDIKARLVQIDNSIVMQKLTLRLQVPHYNGNESQSFIFLFCILPTFKKSIKVSDPFHMKSLSPFLHSAQFHFYQRRIIQCSTDTIEIYGVPSFSSMTRVALLVLWCGSLIQVNTSSIILASLYITQPEEKSLNCWGQSTKEQNQVKITFINWP